MKDIKILTENKSNVFGCIVFGEIIYDIYNNIPQLGGAALNYSWHLSQLGIKVLLISSIGNDDLGKKALEKIQSNDLISYSITVKEPDFIINEDVAWDKINVPSNINKFHAKSFYFGTLSQRSKFNQNSLKQLFRLKNNPYKMFDLNLRKNYHTKPIIEYSLHQANVVKMNQVEFEYIRRLLKIQSPDDLLSIYNIHTILITNGNKSVNLINSKTSMTALPPLSNPIATIGAGDAFFATYTACLLKNLSVDQMLSKSCEIASYTTGRKGSIFDLPRKFKNL